MPGRSIRRRAGSSVSDIEVSAKPFGSALVVHRTGAITESALALAMELAHDPEHDLVVVDLPADLPISVWEKVVSLLPRRRRGVRLVVGRRFRETVALVGKPGQLVDGVLAARHAGTSDLVGVGLDRPAPGLRHGQGNCTKSSEENDGRIGPRSAEGDRASTGKPDMEPSNRQPRSSSQSSNSA